MNATAAREELDLAMGSLINGRAYSLIGKYISPKSDFARMRRAYQYSGQGAKANMSVNGQLATTLLQFAINKFAKDCSTFVAILALNDRKQEAQEIADAPRTELDDVSFHTALEQALIGVIPDP
jgi:hypothetical protein